MDIYIITFADGTEEEYRCFSFFRNRVSELESLGMKKGVDFKTVQFWL